MSRRSNQRRPPPSAPRECREPGCTVQIILAKRAQRRDAWLPLEATDHEPFSIHAAGAWVLVDGLAWKPRALVEQWRDAYEITEDRARELISGYPAHRIHIHEKDDPNE